MIFFMGHSKFSIDKSCRAVEGGKKMIVRDAFGIKDCCFDISWTFQFQLQERLTLTHTKINERKKPCHVD